MSRLKADDRKIKMKITKSSPNNGMQWKNLAIHDTNLWNLTKKYKIPFSKNAKAESTNGQKYVKAMHQGSITAALKLWTRC